LRRLYASMIARRVFVFLPAFSLLASTAVAAQPSVAITGNAVAPLPTNDGSGLCSATTTLSAVALPQNADTFVPTMNGFFEADAAPTVSVHRFQLDLSNNLNDGRTLSYGDFTNVACASTGGCAFAINDATTTFGVRLRGFVRVAANQVGQAVHFGVYTDDAMSLTIFDGASQPHAIVLRPPQLGAPTWRSTNTVTFASAGLYPIEILYAQVVEHAALEIATFTGAFTDFERPANQPPVVALSASSFALLESKDLYQSEEGAPSFADLGQCAQCSREHAGKPGSTGCAAGYHCNAAALCSPCASSAACGASCSPCTGGAACASVDGGYACVASVPPADAGDAGPVTDSDAGRVPPSSDPADAGAVETTPPIPTAPSEDSGCSCQAVGPAGPTGAVVAALGLLISAWRRRKRR
jgi:outer membrane exchange protein TraA